jgi:hypothetical protein
MEETAKDLICRVCLLSAISSAFFTHDTSCMVLTEFVLNFKKKKISYLNLCWLLLPQVQILGHQLLQLATLKTWFTDFFLAFPR